MPSGPEASEPADLDLLLGARAGNREAFGAIFERYQHVVYRFARAMIGSADAAEDVTQEVFVILMRELHRYVPERSALSTYLYGIARNLSRDRIRRDRRSQSLCWLGPGPSNDTSASDPYERMAAVQTQAEVRAALGRLPVRYREVVILCDLHELSYAEVAAILTITVAAVRSRLHRGRLLLRRGLGALERPAQGQAGSLRCSV